MLYIYINMQETEELFAEFQIHLNIRKTAGEE